MTRHRNKRAQTAIEYLLLLGVVAAIALGGFTFWVSRTRIQGNAYFSNQTAQIYGRRPVVRTAGPYP